jgi:hypothetical protein
LRLRFGAISQLFSRHNSRNVCAVSKAIDQRSVTALRNIGRFGKIRVERRSGIDVPMQGKVRMIRVDTRIHDSPCDINAVRAERSLRRICFYGGERLGNAW